MPVHLSPCTAGVAGLTPRTCSARWRCTRASGETPDRRDCLLVMGPWFHAAWIRDDGAKLGDVSFGGKSAEFYREHIELSFYEYHLKGKGEGKHPGAWVFETGANTWRRRDAWPPAGTKSKVLYFHAGGRLREAPPPDARPEDGHDEYLSDPSRPVPFENKTSIRKSQEF